MSRILLIVIILIGAVFLWPRQISSPVPAAPVDSNVAEQIEQVTPPSPVVPPPKAEATPPPLPSTALIKKVPFVPQAPLQVWDARHEDACEEASLLTGKAFLEGARPTKEESERDLQAFINWQEQNGFGPSITVADLKKAAEGYWSKPWWGVLRVKTDGSLDDIRREIAAGHPVIIGAAGKRLLNSHFKNGGPNYHMLVLIGYTRDEFVANDPGTRVGEGYRYPAAVIDDAWHDWDAADIDRGAQNYLVVE